MDDASAAPDDLALLRAYEPVVRYTEGELFLPTAANLAWKLALVVQHRAEPGLMDTYQDERHPIGAMVVRSTTALTAVGTASGPEAAFRDVALSSQATSRGWPPRARRAWPRRRSPTPTARSRRTTAHATTATCGRERTHRTLRASSAPTALRWRSRTCWPGPAWCCSSAARPLLVRCSSDAIDDLRRTLGELGTVVRIVADADAVSEDDVVDPGGVIGKAYGLGTEGLALIRPDGYLGLVSNSADPAVLHGYLATRLRVTQRSTT